MESFKIITNISNNSWDGNDQHKNDAVGNMRRMGGKERRPQDPQRNTKRYDILEPK